MYRSLQVYTIFYKFLFFFKENIIAVLGSHYLFLFTLVHNLKSIKVFCIGDPQLKHLIDFFYKYTAHTVIMTSVGSKCFEYSHTTSWVFIELKTVRLRSIPLTDSAHCYCCCVGRRHGIEFHNLLKVTVWLLWFRGIYIPKECFLCNILLAIDGW